jgi:tetratricopeptide (TPR) repeat protein
VIATAPPSLEYPAVEDALELGALQKALQRARKGLFIAVVDQPVLREAIRLWLSRALDRPLHVQVLARDRSLLEQIREADQTAQPEAILWLEGLEHVSLAEIEALNRQRAGLSNLRHPLLLWTPTFRLQELMERAPDFFDWHSGFYEFKPARTFAPEQVLRWIDRQTPLALFQEERLRRISLLETLRAEYTQGEETLPALATVLFQLGRLYAEGGFDLDLALERYQEALACYERLGDLQGKAATLHEMANVLVTRGDLDGAMRLYQQSLEIKERLGDLSRAKPPRCTNGANRAGHPRRPGRGDAPLPAVARTGGTPGRPARANPPRCTNGQRAGHPRRPGRGDAPLPAVARTG